MDGLFQLGKHVQTQARDVFFPNTSQRNHRGLQESMKLSNGECLQKPFRTASTVESGNGGMKRVDKPPL